MALTNEQLIMLDTIAYFGEFSDNFCPELDETTGKYKYKTVGDFVNQCIASFENGEGYSSYLDAFVSDEKSGIIDVLRKVQSSPELCNLKIIYPNTSSDTTTSSVCLVEDYVNETGEQCFNSYVIYCGNYIEKYFDSDNDGIDDSNTWISDMLGAANEITDEQKLAVEFFTNSQDAINKYAAETNANSIEIVTSGHSAGGNMAQYTALLCEAVTRCVSLDGQGFSDEFINSEEGQLAIALNGHKITNIMPSLNFVGSLLNHINTASYIYVDIGYPDYMPIGLHLPMNLLDGNFNLSEESSISYFSEILHTISVDSIRLMEVFSGEEELESALEGIGKIIIYYVDDDREKIIYELLSNDSLQKLFKIIGTTTHIELPPFICSAIVSDYCDAWVDFWMGVGENVYDWLHPNNSLVLYGKSGNDTLEGGTGDDVIYGAEGDDTLYGYKGIDVLLGEEGNDTLLGGEDNDWLYGGVGDDEVDGGSGNDRVYGGEGSDTINGGKDDDYLYGEEGTDTIHGDDGDDHIYGDIVGPEGTQGNDRLYGDAGSDTIEGGAGNDEIEGGQGYDYIYGGSDDDTIYGDDKDDIVNGSRDEIFGEDGNDTIYGQAGDDHIEGGNGINHMYGGDGGDTIIGGEDEDYIFGAAGQDELYGGNGINHIYGQDDNDVIHGGDDRDIIFGGYGDDEIYGANGENLIYGGFGADTIHDGDDGGEIYGGQNDDKIYAAGGNDTIDGGEGNDTMRGDHGDDTYIFKAGYGIDTIYDAAGSNTINLSGLSLSDVKAYRADGNGLMLSWGADSIILAQFFDGAAFQNYLINSDGGTMQLNSINELYGTDGDDWMALNNNGVILHGGKGGDNIQGGSGNDTLYGDEHNDTLNGDIGDDLIDGGIGDDRLYGGTGSDTYIFGKGYGIDTIEDWGGHSVVKLGDITSNEISISNDYDQNLVISVANRDDKLYINNYRWNQDGFTFEFADGITGTVNRETWKLELASGSSSGSTSGENDSDNTGDSETGGSTTDNPNTGGSSTGDSTGEGGTTQPDVEITDDYVLNGSANSEWLSAPNNNDGVIDAGDGDDGLNGGSSSDKLYGGAGTDNLYGNDGDDILDGGTGTDGLNGGNGTDTYIFAKGYGNDTVNEWGNDVSIIKLTDINSDEVTLNSQSENNLVISVNGTSDTLTISNYRWSQGSFTLEFADGAIATVNKETWEMEYSQYPTVATEETAAEVSEDEMTQTNAEFLTALYAEDAPLAELISETDNTMISEVTDSTTVADETDEVADQTDLQVMILTENMSAFAGEDTVFDGINVADASADVTLMSQLLVNSAV